MLINDRYSVVIVVRSNRCRTFRYTFVFNEKSEILASLAMLGQILESGKSGYRT